MKQLIILSIGLFLFFSQIIFANTGDYKEVTYKKIIKIRFAPSTTKEAAKMVKNSLDALNPAQLAKVSEYIIFVGKNEELSSQTLMFSDEEVSANAPVKGIIIDLSRAPGVNYEEYILQTLKISLEHSAN